MQLCLSTFKYNDMKMKQDECVPLETMHEHFNLSLLEEEDIKAHKGLVLSTGLYF